MTDRASGTTKAASGGATAQPGLPANATMRELTPADLDRVVEIDRAVAGQSRRGFFEKRLAARARDPQAFISLGYAEAGRLEGFALAHLLEGEFGVSHPVAVLDAIGMASSARGHGGGHGLIAELESAARKRGARELRSQSNWADQQMTHFFASTDMKLAHRLVLERPCSKMAGEVAPGESARDDSEDLSRDRIPVRSLKLDDLAAITHIDRAITGRDRTSYYRRKIEEAVNESGIRLSMLASVDDTPAGFIMARVDYGEFGQTGTVAVMDTIGVNSEFAGKQVGTALTAQLLANLEGLHVDRVRTEVEWDDFALLGFLKRLGFRPTQRIAFVKAL